MKACFSSLLVAALIFAGSVEARATVPPPAPEPHPSACKKLKKKHKPCRAKIAMSYDFVEWWIVEDESGNEIGRWKAVCHVRPHKPVLCDLTVTW